MIAPLTTLPYHRSIVMAPSGVQKERMKEDDMFVLDKDGEIIHTPAAKPPPARPPKLSECSPLFMAAYELRGAGAVIHSHSLNAVMATILDPESSEFRVTHLEMIKVTAVKVSCQEEGHFGDPSRSMFLLACGAGHRRPWLLRQPGRAHH